MKLGDRICHREGHIVSEVYAIKFKNQFQVPEVQNHGLEGYCWVAGLCVLYIPLCNLHANTVNHELLLLLSLALIHNPERFCLLYVIQTKLRP